MKKHFSDQNNISILREAEVVISARKLCCKHAISDATFYIYELPRFARNESGFGLLLTSIRDQENLCLNGYSAYNCLKNWTVSETSI